MSVLENQQRRGLAQYSAALEAVIYLIFIALQVLNVYVHVVPLDWLVRINALFLVSLLLIAWKQFDGGVHIVFLFLGTLLLFQAGELLAFTFGPLFGGALQDFNPFQIDLMRAGMPINVNRTTAEMTMLAILISAVCIYMPCRFRYTRLTMPDSPPPRVMRALYRVYFLTVPFLLYKNLRYFLFIKSHGGYLALYTQGADVIGTVSVAARTLSFFATLAFLALYVFETRRHRVYLLTFTYFLGSILDLLIGLRGKVFTLLLMMWLIHVIKRHKRFQVFRIAATAGVLMLLAMAVDSYRGSDDLADIRLPSNPVFYFIAAQGVSVQTTEAVIGYGSQFVRKPFSYLRHEVTSAIIPEEAQVKRPNGIFLADDLGYFLNPDTARLGYGTGSSYLAESYLFGGLLGVIVISSLLGYLLSLLHSASNSVAGILVLAYTMPYLIYLPRDMLLSPVAEIVKISISILLACPLFYVAIKLPRIRIGRQDAYLLNDTRPLS